MRYGIDDLPGGARGLTRGRAGLAVALLCGVVFSVQVLASPPAPEAPGAESQAGAPPRALEALSASALEKTFSRLDYRLGDVRHGAAVPRLFLTSLPADWGQRQSTGQRKRLFLEALLPLILGANESIWAKRERLLEAMRRRAEGETLEWSERAWLNSLAEDYGTGAGQLEELLRRVDIIPPALALAQAAAESGWGTSRFARKGNALFGQRTWTQGAGLVPARRESGERHEVKTFEALPGSVAAYMKNLNRHPAYAAFRAKRAWMRESRGTINGYELAGTLNRYSEARRDYIEILRAIMRVNGLEQLEGAKLRAPQAAPAGAKGAGA